jgi:hypothetical protein
LASNQGKDEDTTETAPLENRTLKLADALFLFTFGTTIAT